MTEMELFKKALMQRKQNQKDIAKKSGIKDAILHELEQIEQKLGVEILHCVDFGKNALGYPTCESEYCVSFIYKHINEVDANLEHKRNFIQWQKDEKLNVFGCDIEMIFNLLKESNPLPFNWNVSPVVYKTSDSWQKIASDINSYFMPKPYLAEQLKLAKAVYEQALANNTVTVIGYFQILTSIFACKWVEQNNTPAPVTLNELLKVCDEDIKEEVTNLLTLPTVCGRIESLDNYIQKSIAIIEEKI